MAVIKYMTKAQIPGCSEPIAQEWTYEEVRNPHKQGKILTRDQATKIIEEKGLVEVCNNRYGISGISLMNRCSTDMEEHSIKKNSYGKTEIYRKMLWGWSVLWRNHKS